jgi:hypothetical protein
VNIGIAALAERPQQIERRGSLGIGLQHPLGVGPARGLGRRDIVDDVAAIAGQDQIADLFGRGGSGLGELAGHPADLHHRAFRRIGQHHGHLQQHPERVANAVGREFGKAFGAVAALQQERLARRDAGQFVAQLAHLAGKNQRRHPPQPGLDRGQRLGIGVIGHLHPFVPPPYRLVPIRRHCLSPFPAATSRRCLAACRPGCQSTIAARARPCAARPNLFP